MSQIATNENGAQRADLREVSEGDSVVLCISMHGTLESHDGPVEYFDEVYKSGVAGTVVEALRDSEAEMLYDSDSGRPMADFVVEADDGTRYNWNVDNGYVLGPVSHPDRPDRSDIGKGAGVYHVDE